MTRLELIEDLKRQIAATPANRHKRLAELQIRLRTAVTRQIAYENKMTRKAA